RTARRPAARGQATASRSLTITTGQAAAWAATVPATIACRCCTSASSTEPERAPQRAGPAFSFHREDETRPGMARWLILGVFSAVLLAGCARSKSKDQPPIATNPAGPVAVPPGAGPVGGPAGWPQGPL